MYSSVRNAIPQFLSDEVVYCDNLNHSRHYRTCLLLTKQLKFYEFHQKSLLNCLDLGQSSLRKVAPSLRTYAGPKGKWFKVDNNQTISDDQQEPFPGDLSIKFGKFFYFNVNVRRLYILVLCWDKLLVIHRPSDSSLPLSLAAEYEDVAGFRVVSGPVKLQAVVEIHFRNGQVITSDLQESKPEAATTFCPGQQSDDFQQMLERITETKTELQIQQNITQDRLSELRNSRVFGSLQQRSQRVEEKQKLSKFGDVWIRLPTNGSVVLGVPLVNNCAPPNTHVARRLRPVIISTEPRSDLKDLSSYEHYFYRMQANFEDLESLETFLQSEDDEFQGKSWLQCNDNSLPPESFGVLIIKLPVEQIINIGECQLLLSFSVEKTAEIDEKFPPQLLTADQHEIFLKDLNFLDILNSRRDYEISFGPRSLHQDFLALAATSREMQFNVKFRSTHDIRIFETSLMHNFDLKSLGSHEAKDASFPLEDDMLEMKTDCEVSGELARHLLLYNDNRASFWYGLLVLKHSYSYSKDTEASWKFFARNQEYAHLFLRQLFKDHLIRNCNVQDIQCSSTGQCGQDQLLKQLEDSLRSELKCLLRAPPTVNMAELKRRQMLTDLVMSSIVT